MKISKSQKSSSMASTFARRPASISATSCRRVCSLSWSTSKRQEYCILRTLLQDVFRQNTPAKCFVAVKLAAMLKQKKNKLFNAFQNSLNQGLQARDEELLKFEKATNKAILDLKNWVLRKIRPMHQNFDDNNSLGAAAHNLTLFDPNKSIFYEASLKPANDIMQ